MVLQAETTIDHWDVLGGMIKSLRFFTKVATLAEWLSDSLLGQWFQTFFIFTPILGEDSHFDEHIFQLGWFNHQLANRL